METKNENPKFILALDASQISEYLTCPLKWYYDYYLRLSLPEIESKRTAPDKGTLVHLLLDWYYTAKQDGADNNDAAIVASKKFILQEETSRLFKKGVINKDGKLEMTAKELETFLVERFFAYALRWPNDFNVPKGGIELGFSKLLYENDQVKFIVEGRIDLMDKMNNGLMAVVDHKTQERAVNLYGHKIQFKTYAWAANVNYAWVNYFRLQKKYEEGNTFRRELIYFTPAELQDWAIRMEAVFWEIYNMLQDAPRLFEMNRNDAACGGAYDSNPCQFTPLCEEYNWEMKERKKTSRYITKEAWTPWKVK